MTTLDNEVPDEGLDEGPDEGLSAEDLDRFSGDTAPCPSCGADIYHEAPQCAECGAWITPGAEGNGGVWKLVVLVVVILIVIAMIGLF